MIAKQISSTLNIPEKIVTNVLNLFSQGATIPFIARYRKEMTNALSEVDIENIHKENEKIKELLKRKETIIKSIDEQGLMDDDLLNKIDNCWSIHLLEDIYMPYKPKRRTKAQIAKEKGLEGLAKIIMAQNSNDVYASASQFVNKDVNSEDDAIAGASHIISEWVSENSFARNTVRRIFSKESVLVSKMVKGKEEEGQKYKDYFDFSFPLRRIHSHTLLAIRRGEKEEFLKVDISVDDDNAISSLISIFKKNNSPSSEIVEKAVIDSYKRLIRPSMVTEFAGQSKEIADREAIKIFADNLRQLLLSPPLGHKRVLAIDPGYRTGCKVVVLDSNGNLLHNDNIYPHPPVNKKSDAMKKISNMVEAYKVEAIAVGNGTAGRETEDFIKKMKFNIPVQVFVVNENGASIYSASKVAREEFPDYDITVRGAVSLGRRLMDPLAELIKIDPKSIGVGQYQYDVNQKELKESLDTVVVSCVNAVGVNLNTASKYLLTYISGIGENLASNIVEYRTENGSFSNRQELMNVPKMGKKSFELSAGFMRIENSDNPLDNTAVHPESYHIVEQMADDCNVSLTDFISQSEVRANINLEKYISSDIGIHTIKDIIEELNKPNRDMRSKISVFEFDKNIKTIDDVKVGMKLPGIVTNIAKFGAFVDIGIHENGLIHISQITDRFISNPNEVLKLNQQVLATVLNVDIERKRIELSLKQ